MKKEQKASTDYSDPFSGIIGQEYDMLKLICPLATEMSHLVGVAVKKHSSINNNTITVVELGGGTGITTLSILLANDNISVVSIDNALTMQKQAKTRLKQWVEEGRLHFSSDDALTALKAMPENSIDIVASAYTLHNFEEQYRHDVHKEIYRILKGGGQFINGDRYGLDDVSKHTQIIQQEIAGYFKVLTQLNKLDVLEYWIIHLFSDESENHIMRESRTLQQLDNIGFKEIILSHRLEVNALVTAKKHLVL